MGRVFVLNDPPARRLTRAATSSWSARPKNTASNQGLTLLHFSAQPKPLWSVSRFACSLCRIMTHLLTEGTQGIPQKWLTLC